MSVPKFNVTRHRLSRTLNIPATERCFVACLRVGDPADKRPSGTGALHNGPGRTFDVEIAKRRISRIAEFSIDGVNQRAVCRDLIGTTLTNPSGAGEFNRLSCITRFSEPDAQETARSGEKCKLACFAGPRGVPPQLENVMAMLSYAINAMGDLSVQLTPPLLHGLQVDAEIDHGANPGVEEERDILFQTAQELLLNVVKHAGVTTATLQLGHTETELWPIAAPGSIWRRPAAAGAPSACSRCGNVSNRWKVPSTSRLRPLQER